MQISKQQKRKFVNAVNPINLSGVGEFISHGIRNNLKEFKSKATYNLMCSLLVKEMSEIAFTQGVESFGDLQVFENQFDFGRTFGLAVKFKITKKQKDSINALLMRALRYTIMKKAQERQARQEKEIAEQELQDLLDGKTKMKKCPMCEGKKFIVDYRGEDVDCYECSGRGKLLVKV